MIQETKEDDLFLEYDNENNNARNSLVNKEIKEKQ